MVARGDLGVEWFRAAVRSAGRDPVVVRTGAPTGHLGGAGARIAGQGGDAFARRGQRCGDGQRIRGVRNNLR